MSTPRAEHQADLDGSSGPVAWISLDALRRNLRALRGRLPCASAIAAVVKSDGYGHGMAQVARAAIEEGCRHLVVSSPEEAAGLKGLRPRPDILIIGPFLPGVAPDVVANGFVTCVGGLEMASALDEAARRQGRRARVHLKIDTGMGRFGFLDTAEGLGAMIERISALNHLDIEGVLTHFSESNDPDSDFTREQTGRFLRVLDTLKAAGLRPRWVHAANSGGVVHFPNATFSMARIGISMYGAYPGPEPTDSLPLEPVMSLICPISEIRNVPAGWPVSYGRTFTTQRESRLALVPVGYGNGYPRRASGRAQVLIQGRRAPVVGRITMNMIVVDVTDLRNAGAGDSVLLFGKRGGDLLPVEDLARAAETISYEILCNVGRCTPRVLVKN